ncbi:hypothetical protein BST61_g5187 [Cercospora zeina]
MLHHLAAVLLLAPTFTLANPSPHERARAGFSFNELFARWDCSGTACGSDGQYCCTAGTSCTTDAANIAGCASAPLTQAAPAAGAAGSWQYYTTTWVETGLVTRTSVWSSYIGGAAATGIACNYALNESPCGTICCASDQYCFSKEQSQCAANGNSGSSGIGAATYVAPGATAGAPIRPTSSGQLTVTATRGPTTTVPFMEPVATGANVTVIGMEEGGGGLSGGAIAGIVIGVLAGLALLALLCFCCCIKGLLDGCLACFGLGGRKKKRRTEIDEYERYSHHSGGGGGRTWYGAARPPARVDRRDERKSSSGKNLLGLGAGLAALWAVLGLKRQRDKKSNEKYSEYSYSSDYYTSASSASSDDRRTRGTRYSRR